MKIKKTIERALVLSTLLLGLHGYACGDRDSNSPHHFTLGWITPNDEPVKLDSLQLIGGEGDSLCSNNTQLTGKYITDVTVRTHTENINLNNPIEDRLYLPEGPCVIIIAKQGNHTEIKRLLIDTNEYGDNCIRDNQDATLDLTGFKPKYG